MIGRDVYRLCFMLGTMFVCTLLITTAKAQSADENLSSALQAGDGEMMDMGGRGGLQDAAYAYRQLALIQDEEDTLLRMMDNLKTKMEHVKVRKRGHIQCLVNLVACYGKRK
ncbi:uncharacterized protein LOC110452294 [Mizuhopecten yessoensis]|uniref:Allatostatin C n=1 Tax=Mizuhopecten yessoensis TaxID=6573 RepID=A0A346GAR8_MIZYE|nr:uncharacterized protein LOC110452294 [Mizuhopecten yessoensis]AXN93471.1 allatostatin C [Mizuhopecten yessoensis]